MMQPGFLPLPLRRNATAAQRVVLYALDEHGAEAAMDLTGYRLMMDVRLYPGAPGAALMSLSTTSGLIAITDAPHGEVHIEWPEIVDLIAALPALSEPGDPSQPRVDTFAYDLLLIAPDDAAQAILEGPVPVSYGVTVDA